MDEACAASLSADLSPDKHCFTKLPSFWAGFCLFQRTEPLYACPIWQSYGLAHWDQRPSCLCHLQERQPSQCLFACQRCGTRLYHPVWRQLRGWHAQLHCSWQTLGGRRCCPCKGGGFALCGTCLVAYSDCGFQKRSSVAGRGQQYQTSQAAP